MKSQTPCVIKTIGELEGASLITLGTHHINTTLNPLYKCFFSRKPKTFALSDLVNPREEQRRRYMKILSEESDSHTKCLKTGL